MVHDYVNGMQGDGCLSIVTRDVFLTFKEIFCYYKEHIKYKWKKA